MKRNAVPLLLAACAALPLLPPVRGQRPFNRLTSATLDGTPILAAGEPSPSHPYLGLILWDHTTESGEARCFVRIVRPGPIRETRSVNMGDLVLSLNGREVHTTEEFRQAMALLSPGSEATLRIRRPSPKPETVRTVTARAASWAEWAAPTDFTQPHRRTLAPADLVNSGTAETRMEQFLREHLDTLGLSQPIGNLRKYLADTIERNYSANMLSRVAYGFYRPARLAELQVSITDPLLRAVDQNRNDPALIPSLVLAEAARNLDVPFTPGNRAQLRIGNPGQALRDAAGLVRPAYTHLNRAFERTGPAGVGKLEASVPGLLDSQRWADLPVVRSRQAAMAIDYASLFAAADAITSWRSAGEPPVVQSPPSETIPPELAAAVKGSVLAAERIDGRWYVYGGPGRNEYDMSLLDVVIDAGGDDHYRYPRYARPKVQLIADWAGDDTYSGEDGAAGPASALLGVSVIIDRLGKDRYEGADRSCGVGVLGIGLLFDLQGNDTYQGTKWSLGAAKYGFGAILDLGAGSDVYIAHEHSQAIGGPRGFGLILDEAGHELYRVNGPVPSERGIPGIYWSFSQGVGKGDYWPGIGAYDAGGIGVLCDLEGNDRFEAGEFGQGMGYYFGLGILYDRNGRDLYYGSLSTQAAAAHGGVGILADDAGDDTYWGAIARAQDSSLALLIDRGGSDSYQGAHGVGTLGSALNQGFASLIDLDGQDRYSLAASPAAGIGQSSDNGFNYADCQCFSLSVLLDLGGTPDFYSRRDRLDGMTVPTGKANPQMPQYSNLHGLFIDTPKRVTLWPAEPRNLPPSPSAPPHPTP